MSDEKELSEFGKGFISCLVNFAGHFGVTFSSIATMDSVQLWANGASDHLYDIEAPAGEQWNEVREMVGRLKEKGLRMGHGYTGEIYKDKDIVELCKWTREIAVKADGILGVDSDSGKWS